VIAVEPNTLLRLGILQLLGKPTFDVSSRGIDYSQLFKTEPGQDSVDLILLSVPQVYDRVVELIAVAQRGYDPKHILLLSSTPALTYSLLNLPPIVAGYISKYSSREVLTASIMLVLAGGKCFPVQEAAQAEGSESAARDRSVTPRRRWYDKPTPPPSAATDIAQPDNLAAASGSFEPLSQRFAAHNVRDAAIRPKEAQHLSPSVIANEAEMLGVTPRQFEVLALLAKGCSIKGISRELNISIATTKVHAQTLYQRLGVHNRNAAIHTAFSHGATLGWSGLDVDVSGGNVAKS
jgi:DNA-binding NarL/FixJ family response regulator